MYPFSCILENDTVAISSQIGKAIKDETLAFVCKGVIRLHSPDQGIFGEMIGLYFDKYGSHAPIVKMYQ